MQNTSKNSLTNARVVSALLAGERLAQSSNGYAAKKVHFYGPPGLLLSVIQVSFHRPYIWIRGGSPTDTLHLEQ
jgi:hypothetical protein